jgi:hypothetical protein
MIWIVWTILVELFTFPYITQTHIVKSNYIGQYAIIIIAIIMQTL